MVDDQFHEYTVARLSTLKQQHEAWVGSQLGFDAAKIRDDEIYADYVGHWANAVRLDQWRDWASSPLDGGQPVLSVEMNAALNEIRPWLLSRVWPGRYDDLEAAFTNFRYVAQDFSRTFEKHAEKLGENNWRTARFYRLREWNPERYAELVKQFEGHVALVEDLLLELTRAANYVCDKVRERILPAYRLREGVLLVTSGPYSNFSIKTHRVEYRGDERTLRPYPGIDAFKTARFGRDFFFGNEDDIV
jgi:hypothetical protein